MSWTELASHRPFWSKTCESAWISLATFGDCQRSSLRSSLTSSHNQCFYNFTCVSQCFTHVDCVDAVTGASSWEQLCNSLAIFLGSLQCSAVQDFLDIICSYPLSLLPPRSAWAASPVALPSDTTVVFVLNTVGPCESCLWIWQCLPQKRVSNDNQGNLNFVLPNFQPCIALPPSRKITLAAVVGPRPHQQLLAGPAQHRNLVRLPTLKSPGWPRATVSLLLLSPQNDVMICNVRICQNHISQLVLS